MALVKPLGITFQALGVSFQALGISYQALGVSFQALEQLAYKETLACVSKILVSIIMLTVV